MRVEQAVVLRSVSRYGVESCRRLASRNRIERGSSMRLAFVCLFVFVCCVGTAEAQQSARSYRVDIALDVDTQGRVAQATPSDDLPQPLAVPVQGVVSQWRFQPRLQNGVAVTARTYARVMVELVPQGSDKYGLRLKYLSNGPSLKFTRPLAYPPAMMRARAEGTVTMAAVVQPDGSLTDIRLTDSKVTAHSATSSKHAAEVFAHVMQDAMQQMQAKPEWIDGKPVASAITLPITFSLMSGPSAGNASGSAVGAASGTSN